MKSVCIAILSLGFLNIVAFAQTPAYKYATLNYPGHNSDTWATGINDKGVVVGYTSAFGFEYRHGKFTSFQVPGASGTFPNAVNNAGSIVGYYNANQATHGFLLQGGHYTTIDYPNAGATWAMGITNMGEVIGTYAAQGGDKFGFLWTASKGFVKTFSFPNQRGTWGIGINQKKQITGTIESLVSGYVLSKGQFSSFQVPGSTSTGGAAINNAEDVVGFCVGCFGGGSWGFLKVGNTYTQISPPNSGQTQASGINDSGVIVGYYSDGSGTHGYVATP